MIQLGGMFLVMAGAVVAPFVKKILGSAKSKELTKTKKTIDNNSESAEDKQRLNSGEDKSLTTTPPPKRQEVNIVLRSLRVL